MFPRVTHQCATLMINSKLSTIPVQLACVKPAASVRSEPGSNSQFNWSVKILPILITHKEFSWFLYFRYYRLYFINIPSAYPLLFYSRFFITCLLDYADLLAHSLLPSFQTALNHLGSQPNLIGRCCVLYYILLPLSIHFFPFFLFFFAGCWKKCLNPAFLLNK